MDDEAYKELRRAKRSRQIEILFGFLSARLFPLALIVLITIYATTRGFPRLAETSTSTVVSTFLLVALTSGLLCFSLIQVAKTLLGLRGIYYRQQVRSWLRGRNPRTYKLAYRELVGALGGPTGEPRPTHERESKDGKRFSEPEDVANVWQLPIEQLSAQISSAVDFALTFPGHHAALLSALVGGSYDRMSRRLENISNANESGDDAETSERAELMRYRLDHYAKSSVDQLQISLGYRWQTYLRATAVWVTGLLSIIVVGIVRLEPDLSGYVILGSMFVGGAFSWAFRDIASWLEGARR